MSWEFCFLHLCAFFHGKTLACCLFVLTVIPLAAQDLQFDVPDFNELRPNEEFKIVVKIGRSNCGKCTVLAENIPPNAQFRDMVFTWKPKTPEEGEKAYKIQFLLKDSASALLADHSISMQVPPVDIVFDPPLTFRCTEGSPLEFTAKAFRGKELLEDASLFYEIDGEPIPWNKTIFSWTPLNMHSRSGSIVLAVKVVVNGQPVLARKEYTFRVADVDQAPHFVDPVNDIDSTSFSIDEPLAYTFKAEDPDGDALIYQVDPRLPGMTVSQGILQWKITKDNLMRDDVFPKVFTLKAMERNNKEMAISRKLVVDFKNSKPELDVLKEYTFSEGEILKFKFKIQDKDNASKDFQISFKNGPGSDKPVIALLSASILSGDVFEATSTNKIPFTTVDKDESFDVIIKVADKKSFIEFVTSIKIVDKMDPDAVDEVFKGPNKNLNDQIIAEQKFNDMWKYYNVKSRRRSNVFKAVALGSSVLAVAGAIAQNAEEEKKENGEGNNYMPVVIASGIISVASVVVNGAAQFKEGKMDALKEVLAKSDTRLETLRSEDNKLKLFMRKVGDERVDSRETVRDELDNLEQKIAESNIGLESGRQALSKFKCLSRFKRRYERRESKKNGTTHENRNTLNDRY